MKPLLIPNFLILAVLCVVAGCGRTPSGPVEQPRQFLQTRQELSEKYGNPDSRKQEPGHETLAFHSGDLSVRADLAGDECHQIHYVLPHDWTDAQISAALEKNGSGWRSTTGATGLLPIRTLQILDFQSSEGHRARYSGPSKWLDINSVQVVRQAQLAGEEKKRKAEAIPKF